MTIDPAEKLATFLRCKNSVNLPESMCTLCLQTLVAPNFEALEQAELNHSCRGESHARWRLK